MAKDKKSNFQILGHFLQLLKAEPRPELDIVQISSRNVFPDY